MTTLMAHHDTKAIDMTKNRKIAATLVAGVGLITALTACETSDNGNPGPNQAVAFTTTVATVTKTADPTASATSDPGWTGDAPDTLDAMATKDEEISESKLGFLLSEAFSYIDVEMTPEMSYRYATVTCQGLDDGLSPDLMSTIAADNFAAYDVYEHSYMLGASVGLMCPEHGDKI